MLKSALLAISLLFAPVATAQADRAPAIEAIRKALRDNYVIKERRAALDATLAKGLASKRYAVADPEEFARRVSADMEAVAHDKHLSLRFNPALAAQMGAGKRDDDVTESAFWIDLARRQNHGVRELKVLDGNVRLMRYDGFFWNGEASKQALAGAMAFLRGGDAIIIDIRMNGGGSPDAVRHLTSYFVPAGAKLVTFHMRDEAPIVSYADTDVPGGRIGDVPVYVLTSGGSASAAEEFAAHVAGFGFATLIGETTAGAAYRNDFFPVPGGFALSVSVGRPELPGGGDWEAKGVAPKFEVAQDLALDRAMQDALTTLAPKASGPLRTELEWAAAAHAARIAPGKPTLALAHYAGRYGERAIHVEGESLVFRRDGGLRSPMLPLGGDLFAIERDPRSRIRFVVANGTVTGFVLERADGSKVEAPRA